MFNVSPIMWLRMHMGGTWVSFMSELIWAQRSQLNPETSGLGRPPQMRWIIQCSQKQSTGFGIFFFFFLCLLHWQHSSASSQTANRAGFLDVTLWRSPSLWWRARVHLELAMKDPEKDLWLGRWTTCLWDDGFFILAAMNYWDVESAMSWTGACGCVCVCV